MDKNESQHIYNNFQLYNFLCDGITNSLDKEGKNLKLHLASFYNLVTQIKFKCALSLIFVYKKSILINAVLGGKVAVSCNSQSALARLNSFSEVEYM